MHKKSNLIPSSRLSLSKRSLIMRSESFLHLWLWCLFGLESSLSRRYLGSTYFKNIQQKCLERWFKIANGFNVVKSEGKTKLFFRISSWFYPTKRTILRKKSFFQRIKFMHNKQIFLSIKNRGRSGKRILGVNPFKNGMIRMQ